MRLEQWCTRPSWDHTGPVQYVLAGEVYEHPDFGNGEYVRTSRIVSIDEDTVKTSSGSVYTLGEVDPEFLSAVPDIRERLNNLYGAKDVQSDY